MPAIVVKMIAHTRINRKLKWMPGRLAAKPVTPTWRPSSLPTLEKKPEPSQPMV